MDATTTHRQDGRLEIRHEALRQPLFVTPEEALDLAQWLQHSAVDAAERADEEAKRQQKRARQLKALTKGLNP